MAVIDNTRSAYVSNSGFAPLTNLFSAFAAWNDARQTRKALGSLTDRELDDIGLCRGDIEDVAAGYRYL